jgi:hypothetical protein
MKLDRNINSDGMGKYALIKRRDTGAMEPTQSIYGPLAVIPWNAVDFGGTPDTDFFVIRLKDKYAAAALGAYAEQARKDDPEYADEILALAEKAATHPNKRKPD